MLPGEEEGREMKAVIYPDFELSGVKYMLASKISKNLINLN